MPCLPVRDGRRGDWPVVPEHAPRCERRPAQEASARRELQRDLVPADTGGPMGFRNRSGVCFTVTISRWWLAALTWNSRSSQRGFNVFSFVRSWFRALPFGLLGSAFERTNCSVMASSAAL